MDLDSKGRRPADEPQVIPWSGDECDLVIGRRFERVAKRMGDAPALCLGDHTHTYRELRASADRITGVLHALGKTGRVVLYLTNSFHHFAAALGALKAAWVIIPMDPDYPSKRSGQILGDAAPDLILTDLPNREALWKWVDEEMRPNIRLVEETLSDGPRPPVPDQSKPETPALILYTSGSTGTPKGVLHTHQSIAHNCLRRSRVQHLGTNDRLSLLYSSSVMGGIFGIYGALLNGAALYPKDIKRDGLGNFVDWIKSSRITVYHSVTTLFRQVVSLASPIDRFPDLRLVILGGEQALDSDIKRGRTAFGKQIEFYCGIGSTETGSIRHYPIAAGAPVDPGPVPLGYPIEGMEVLLLDPDRNPVPVGQVGEIAVRSQYLATEYWRRPELNRERFIPDPDRGPLPVFVTGDLGKIDASGCLTSCGRGDQQVKIRGFRVEPAEIDAAVLAMPEIEGARTIAVPDHKGSHALACFYVCHESRVITEKSLRHHLQTELPAYLVPDSLVKLEVFPRTANGKIDTRALKVPEPASIAAQNLPETPTEKHLAEIWASALEQPSVSVDQGFFDQGGNSLIAAMVSAQIEKAFGHRLPISYLFEYPTIRSLAAWIDSSKTDRPWSCIVPIRPQGSGKPVYIIGGLTGEIFFCHRLIHHLRTERPIFALEPDTHSGGLTRHARIEDVANHYAEAIREHQPDGPYTIAGYSFGGVVAYELARQLSTKGLTIERLILIDSNPPKIASAPERRGEVKSDRPRPTQVRPQTSLFRIFKPSWWMRSKGHWRRSYWRFKYVRLYELLVRMHLSPPVSWRRCYAYWAAHWMGSRYRAKPYRGPAVLFRSEARRDQGDRGWRDLCGKSLYPIIVPGQHGSIFGEPNVQVLARELDSILETGSAGRSFEPFIR